MALGAFEIEKNTVYFFRSMSQIVEKNAIPTEKDHFVAVLSKDHPLVDQAPINLAALAKENFLLLGQAQNSYYSVEQLCREAGFDPRITYQGTRIDLILRMIEEGLGISLMMEKSLGDSLSEELVVREILPTKESYLYFCLSEETDAQASKAFFNFLHSYHSKLE